MSSAERQGLMRDAWDVVFHSRGIGASGLLEWSSLVSWNFQSPLPVMISWFGPEA